MSQRASRNYNSSYQRQRDTRVLGAADFSLEEELVDAAPGLLLLGEEVKSSRDGGSADGVIAPAVTLCLSGVGGPRSLGDMLSLEVKVVHSPFW